MVPQSLCQELEAREEAEREAVAVDSGQAGQAEQRSAVASLDSKVRSPPAPGARIRHTQLLARRDGAGACQLVPEEFGFPPTKSPASRGAEDGAQSGPKAKIDGKDGGLRACQRGWGARGAQPAPGAGSADDCTVPDTPLFYGTVVALENLEGGFLTLPHNGGDLRIKSLDPKRSDVHGNTTAKMEQSLFTVRAPSRPLAPRQCPYTAAAAAPGAVALMAQVVDMHDRANCGPIKDGDHVWLRVAGGCGDPTWREGSVLGARAPPRRACRR